MMKLSKILLFTCFCLINIACAGNNNKDKGITPVILPDIYISIDNASISEGNSGSPKLDFIVSSNATPDTDIFFRYTTKSQTAIAGEDFVASNGIATIPSGSDSINISIAIMPNINFEPDKTFQVIISSPQRANITKNTAIGTIVNDDNGLRIVNSSIIEGNTGTRNLQLVVESMIQANSDINFGYRTEDGTAKAGEDYIDASGTAIILAGERTTTIDIVINGDTKSELDEEFIVALNNLPGEPIDIVKARAVSKIINDDYRIRIEDAEVVEGNNESTILQFTVIANFVTTSDIQISYDITGGSATASKDFIQKAGTAIILAGSSSTIVAITINGDLEIEKDETIDAEIRLINPSASISISRATAIGTIKDNDILFLSINNVEITEGNQNQKVVFTINTNSLAISDINFNYSIEDGSATASKDYIDTSGVGFIPQGSDATSIEVEIIGDLLAEANETFSVILTNNEGAEIELDRAIGLIKNDDIAYLSIADGSTQEGNSRSKILYFTLTTDILSSIPIEVDYRTQTNTATAGEDFIYKEGTATILAGERTATIDIEINGDTKYEEDENFDVLLSSPKGGTINKSSSIGTIINDDLPELQITNKNIKEGNGGIQNLEFEITTNSIVFSDVSVDYRTENGTAIAGEDYVNTTGTATISAGQDRTTIYIGINGDTKIEFDEIFDVVLNNPQGVKVVKDRATVTIENDDYINLTISDVSESEGNSGTKNFTFMVVANEIATSAINFSYRTEDGTAIGGEDYESVTTSAATISAGQDRVSIDIVVNGDTDIELDETFDVVLSNPQGAIIQKDRATGTIEDDDSFHLSIADATTIEGNNGLTDLVFQVTSNLIAIEDITVNYRTEAGTAIGGEDYEATTGTATITVNQNSTIVTIRIKGDTDVERDEEFNVVLENAQGSKISKARAVGGIINDDFAYLSIADATAAEGDNGTKNLTFKVTSSTTSDTDITVSYVTANGTATAGEDYELVATGTTTILKGTTTSIANIVINGDAEYEADETFDVVLSNPQGAGATIDSNKATATGEIINDDLAKLSIENETIQEGNTGRKTLTFRVTSSAISGLPISFDYNTQDGSATAGEDYEVAAGRGTIIVGSDATTINIEINGDTKGEPDETFTITLSNPQGVTIDSNKATGIGTIEDDDLAKLRIADATTTEGDNGTKNITFQVTSSITPTANITVDYITNQGTATAGEDYTDKSGEVTILQGNTIATIDIEIRGDTKSEADEIFNIEISNLQGVGATIDKTNARATGKIINDDLAKLSIADATAIEGDSGTKSLIFIVTSSATVDTEITVSYVTANGTAAAGEDYVATTGETTISSFDTTSAINIVINGDTKIEADETFTITLSSPQGATIDKTNARATGTIKEDDIAKLSIADETIQEGNAGNQNLTFTVTLNATSDFPISFNYTTTNDTATATEDYTAKTGTGTISSGAMTATVDIEIIGDLVVEADEIFSIIVNLSQGATSDEVIANGSILNDDNVTLSIADATTEEGDIGDTNLLEFKITTSATSDLAISFIYTITSGTALSDDDFFNEAALLEIPPGSREATIDIEIIGDVIVESDENFSITLQTPINVSFSDNIAEGIIVNDDKTTLSINDASVKEDTESITFIVNSSATSHIPIRFSYTTTSDTATAVEDFISKEGDITIPARDGGYIFISILINKDTIVEPNEVFFIDLDTMEDAVRLGKSRGVGEIINDDITISIAAINSPITEPTSSSDTKNANFRITLTNPIANDLIINYGLSGTASQNDDYIAPINYSVTLAAQTTTVDIPIAIKGDDIYENDETLIITLRSLTEVGVYLGAASTATATIKNNSDDKPNVSISGPATIIEGSAATFTVRITPRANFDYNFEYEVSTAGNAPITNDDLTGINLDTKIAGMIPKNTDSTTITIRTLDDNISELNEEFIVTVYDSISTVDIITSTAQVTIIDNDLGEISGATAIAGSRQVRLRWTNPVGSDFVGATIARATGLEAPDTCSGGMDGFLPADSTSITNLIENTSYSFRICIRDGDGNFSSGVVLNNIIPFPPGDTDRNRLIEIRSLNDLNTKVRNNLNGTSDECINCIGFEVVDLARNYIKLNDLPDNWVPIGDSNNPFSAIFEGNDVVIDRLIIDLPNSNNVGFFGVVRDATISDIALIQTNVKGRNNTGTFAGRAINSHFSNIATIFGSVIGEENTGGLVGDFSGTITDSTNEVNVTVNTNSKSPSGIGNIGGLIGRMNNGAVRNSNSSGTVTINVTRGSQAGGLVGLQSSGTISNSWASGNITSTSTSTNSGSGFGGLVGLNENGHIRNSWATGNLNINKRISVGGLVGIVGGISGTVALGNGSIINSWATGNITGSANEYGGLIGSLVKGTVKHSWANGDISGTGFFYGGLVGAQHHGTIAQSWAGGDVSISGTGYVAGGLVGGLGTAFVVGGGTITQTWAAGAVSITGTATATNKDKKGGLVGSIYNNKGDINGRNYRVDSDIGKNVSASNSIEISLDNLGRLSGLNGTNTTVFSEWHAGFDGADDGSEADLDTRFCDTDNSGRIEMDEQMANNSVWVMPPGSEGSDNPGAPGAPGEYYWIPAIRCIGTTPAERRANIDRQRLLFPTP